MPSGGLPNRALSSDRPVPPNAPSLPLTGSALGGAVLAMSAGAVFARYADAPALVTSAYRVGLAVAIIAPAAWWRGRGELMALTWRQLGAGILAGLFLAMHFAAWIASLSRTSVANSVVLVNTVPLWVGLLGPLVIREPVPRKALAAILIGFLGSLLISVEGLRADGGLAGNLLALIGGFSAALYILVGRRLRRTLSLLGYVSVCYGAAAITLWGLVLALGLPVGGYSRGTWTAFVGMALVSQIGGHTTCNWALRWVSPAMMAIALLGEPLLATAWAYWLFDESVAPIQAGGAALILAAVTLAARQETG